MLRDLQMSPCLDPLLPMVHEYCSLLHQGEKQPDTLYTVTIITFEKNTCGSLKSVSVNHL